MVEINSGPVEPTDKFNETPKDKWWMLLIAKRSFLGRRLEHDCRCLIGFCEEAEEVHEELGFSSAEEMIREGYELEPAQVSLAVAWLRNNETEQAISISAVIAEAKAKPLAAKPGKPEGAKGGNQHTVANVDNINKSEPSRGGTGTEYTLRRLARDCPEMLDKIEAGEMSVNQAAIAAGIRKKPTSAEVCVRVFRKVDDKQGVLRMLMEELSPEERAEFAKSLKAAD